MIKIKFDTADVNEYMDSKYNTYDILSVEALIDNKEATIFIGSCIRITDGHVTVAYKDKEYDTVYGECVNNDIERDILSMIKHRYNTDDVFGFIDGLKKFGTINFKGNSIEYEIYIDESYSDKITGCDEWGAAFVWVDKDHGAEYNFCYDSGECCSAIYKTEMNYNDRNYPYGCLQTDYDTFEHYEIDFNDKDWRQKLINKMIESAYSFFEERR